MTHSMSIKNCFALSLFLAVLLSSSVASAIGVVARFFDSRTNAAAAMVADNGTGASYIIGGPVYCPAGAGGRMQKDGANVRYQYFGCLTPYVCPDPTFSIEPLIGVCVACVLDGDCSDGLTCTGEETCSNNVCVDGTPPDCPDSDGLTCTPGICEEVGGCSDGPSDPALCECTEPELPNLRVAVSREVGGLAIACPIVGGDVEAKVTISDSMEYQEATCHNSCDSQFSGAMDMNFVARLCSSSGTQPIDVALKGSAARTEDGCAPVCKDGTCELACEGGGCVTTNYAGNVSPSVSRDLGVKIKKRRIFGSGLDVRCGALVKGTVSLEGSTSETENQGACTECQQCTQRAFTGTLGAEAIAQCKIKGSVFGSSFDLALENLGVIGAAFSADHRGTTGACGDTYCAGGSMVIKGGVRIPVPVPGARWWGLPKETSLVCSAAWNGCTEYNSCGTCTKCNGCESTDLKLTCGLEPLSKH